MKIAYLLVIITFLSCNGSTEPGADHTLPDTTDPSAESPDTVIKAQPAEFQFVKIKNLAAFNKLADSLGDNRTDLILKLNRRDRKHIRKNDSLVVPIAFDETRLSPFPTFLESIKDVPKMILVSRKVQVLGAYEYGRLVHWGPTSTGKRSTPTPAGLYHANWKEELRISSVDSTWLMPWCVNISRSGIAMHAYGVPGYPASHSCVRLPEEDAQWIFYWVDLRGSSAERRGTPVLIFDSYAFGERQPWKRLPQDPNADKVDINLLESTLAERMADILPAQRSSDSLLATASTQ